MKAATLYRGDAIDRALSLALWHVRQSMRPCDVHAATARACRAAAALKQGCSELAFAALVQTILNMGPADAERLAQSARKTHLTTQTKASAMLSSLGEI